MIFEIRIDINFSPPDGNIFVDAFARGARISYFECCRVTYGQPDVEVAQPLEVHLESS